MAGRSLHEALPKCLLQIVLEYVPVCPNCKYLLHNSLTDARMFQGREYCCKGCLPPPTTIKKRKI